MFGVTANSLCVKCVTADVSRNCSGVTATASLLCVRQGVFGGVT